MKQGIAICVGLMALGVGAADQAQAQGYYGPPRFYGGPPVHAVVPPGEILMMVRAAGLRPLTQPARRGHRYLLLASDHAGGQYRVTVNAYDGRIVRVMPAHDPRFAYYPVRPRALVPVPHYGAPPPRHYGAPPPRYSAAPPPEMKDPPPAVYGSRSLDPRPPTTTGSTPDPRLASAPPAADPAPARPTRTPLPRPRPATAAKKAAPTETAAAPVAAAEPPASPPATTAQAKPPAPPTETKLVPVAPLE